MSEWRSKLISYISLGREGDVDSICLHTQLLTNWIFLSIVLGFSSVPVFESYIINDPKAFYILVGIVFDHNFNDSREPLPLEVRKSFL